MEQNNLDKTTILELSVRYNPNGEYSYTNLQEIYPDLNKSQRLQIIDPLVEQGLVEQAYAGSTTIRLTPNGKRLADELIDKEKAESL